MDIKVDENTVIVFDLDDTLYNEIDYLKSAYVAVAKKLKPDNWEQLYTYIFSLYRNNQNVFEYLSENYDITKEQLLHSYRYHIPNIKPFDGVIETFENIKQQNGKIGILTDGRKVTQTNKLNALGLTHFIDHIVISEVIGSEKPAANNYVAFEKFHKSGTYFYIGDNYKKDFITPKSRGWQTVALMDSGLNIHSHAHSYSGDEYCPHHYIKDFSFINIV